MPSVKSSWPETVRLQPFRIDRRLLRSQNNQQDAYQEEALPAKVHRPVDRHHEKTQPPQHRAL